LPPPGVPPAEPYSILNAAAIRAAKELQARRRQTLIASLAAAGGGLAITLAVVLTRVRRWYRRKRLIIFLSYRVSTDADVVAALYDKLTALGVRVWWDKVCLEPGQAWEEGFADGLLSSAIFVPILSKGALSSFATLAADSPCDNVLLEYVLALDHRERGRLKACFPLFVGPRGDDGAYGNFFAAHSLPACEDVVVHSVKQQAIFHLRRRYGPKQGANLRGVEARPGAVLATLCKHQGGFVEGSLE
jgi:hypothetical protein